MHVQSSLILISHNKEVTFSPHNIVKLPVATKQKKFLYPVNMGNSCTVIPWEKCRHQQTAGTELCPPFGLKNNRQSIKGGSRGGRDLFLFKELQQCWAERREGNFFTKRWVKEFITFYSKYPEIKIYLLVFPFTITIIIIIQYNIFEPLLNANIFSVSLYPTSAESFSTLFNLSCTATHCRNVRRYTFDIQACFPLDCIYL